MMLEYDTLKLVWWVLVGALLIGFAVTDGFDMGAGALLPFLGRTDFERRVIINSVGATWEGNQTWLITAVGAVFAAWPVVYATTFSGFYFVMVLVLFALFLRPVGFDYRGKIEDPRWRASWDWALCIGSAVPAFLFGVAFGNLLLGVPFSFDDTMRLTYTGTFVQMLHPFALLCGVVSLAMLVMHGAFWLQVRTEGVVVLRAQQAARLACLVVMACFAAAGWWVAEGLDGCRIVASSVERAPGAWLDNYQRYDYAVYVPIAGFAGPLAALALGRLGFAWLALGASAVSVAAIILTAGVSMFPFIVPSSSHPNASLTVWNAVSSHLTLQIMLWVVLLFLPLVMLYTGWVYRVMRGRVSVKAIADDTHRMY